MCPFRGCVSHTRFVLSDITFDGVPSSLAEMILESLAYLESKRVLNLDVSPSNYLISLPLCDASPAFEMWDFGMSLKLPVDVTDIQPNVNVGTEHFIAPEAAALGRYSFKASVYSAGAIIYWFLTGSAVPTDLNALNLRHCPARLRPLLKRMLSHSPSQRPSAKEALEQLCKSTNPLEVFTTLALKSYESATAASFNPITQPLTYKPWALPATPIATPQNDQVPFKLFGLEESRRAHLEFMTASTAPRTDPVGSVFATTAPPSSLAAPVPSFPGLDSSSSSSSFSSSPAVGAFADVGLRFSQPQTLANDNRDVLSNASATGSSSSGGRSRRSATALPPAPYPPPTSSRQPQQIVKLEEGVQPDERDARTIKIAKTTFRVDWPRAAVQQAFQRVADWTDTVAVNQSCEEIVECILKRGEIVARTKAFVDDNAPLSIDDGLEVVRPIVMAFCCARELQIRDGDIRAVAAETLRKKLVDCGVRGVPKQLVKDVCVELNKLYPDHLRT